LRACLSVGLANNVVIIYPVVSYAQEILVPNCAWNRHKSLDKMCQKSPNCLHHCARHYGPGVT